jgi:gluconolactonase
MEERMRTLYLSTLAAGAVLLCAVPVVITTSIAQTPAQPVPAAPPPPAPQMPPSIPATYVVDLMTPQGSHAFGAQWRTMEAKIVETKPIPGAMPQYKTAYDIMPKAGEAVFDDSRWPMIEAKDLSARRSGGHVAFIWYRANLTVPAKVGDFDTTGAKAVLTVLVDDYAEVWVNGQMPRRAGYPSPATIQGFNMPNRVVLSESVKPGDKFQVAVFGINGPISVAPANTVWFREARLEFYR